jgi:hypothetical protein
MVPLLTEGKNLEKKSCEKWIYEVNYILCNYI